MPQLSLIATSAFGVEAVVKRELDALGYTPGQAEAGRVYFEAPADAICRCNLWLRCADRVLLHVGSFPSPDFDALFDQVYALPWHEWIPADAEFPVRGKSIRSKLTSVPACQRTTKKAIVLKLQDAHGVKILPETGPKFQIEIALLNDRATLTIDTSGDGLHKRGYRTQGGTAPIKETLAAALLELSYWRPSRALIDPFCGVGTIPIEAAMVAQNLAPGRNRKFVSETWPRLPQDAWQAARTEARDLQRASGDMLIWGSDLDDRAIAAAVANAKQAGVDDCIHFEPRAFEQLNTAEAFGCIVTNPPYGERLEDTQALRGLYESMPGVLAKIPSWSHFVLTSFPSLEATIGRKADKRRKLYNGRISCTYYQFYGPPPSRRDRPTERGSEIVPAFGRLPDNAEEQAADFRSRLLKRARHFRRWPGRGIPCYRLYDRDVPGVPLVVDRYDDCLHVSEFKRTRELPEDQHQAWLELMVKVVGEVLEVPRDRTFLKQRQRQSGANQYSRVSEEQFMLTVEEAGLQFRVNLSDYADTGLFLDHRQTRAMIRDRATGCKFLNLFGYTGAFTVYAAAGGASSTTTVDLSANYLEWAEKNMALNGFADSAKHRIVRGDSARFLESLPATEMYDLVIVDPPTFSNSKAMTDTWDIQRDHVSFLNLVLSHTNTGGVIMFSTNARKFRFQDDELAADTADVREITQQTVPDDFPNKPHRAWFLTKK